jgi:hypothetical protein
VTATEATGTAAATATAATATAALIGTETGGTVMPDARSGTGTVATAIATESTRSGGRATGTRSDGGV